MKVLLDESIPVKLKKDFREFEVFTKSEIGWNGLKNGILLERKEENNFTVLITLDKNLRYQQNLDKFSVKGILININDARTDFIISLISKITEILRTKLLVINQKH